MRIAIDMIETDEDYDKLTMETPVVVWLAMDIVLNKGQYSPVEITRDSKKIVDGRARLFVAKNVFEQKYVEAVYVPEFSEEEIRQYTASKYFVQKALNKWERAELWDAYVNYVQLKKPEYYPFLTPGRPPAYEEKRDEFPLLTNEQVAEAFNISTRTLRRETHIYRNLTPRLREMAIDEDLSQSVAEEYARLPMPYKEKIEQALTSHKDQISLREALKDGLTRTSEVLGYGKQKPKPALKVHVGELVQPFPTVRTEHMDREVKDFLRSKQEFIDKDVLAIKPIAIINQKDGCFTVLQSIPTNEDITNGLEDGLYQLHKFLIENPKYKGMYIQENRIVGESKHVYVNKKRVTERELISIYLGTSKKGGYF